MRRHIIMMQDLPGRRPQQSGPVPAAPQRQQGGRSLHPGMAARRHGDTGQCRQQHHPLFAVGCTDPAYNALAQRTDLEGIGRRGKSHGGDRRKTTHQGVSREPSGRDCRMLLLRARYDATGGLEIRYFRRFPGRSMLFSQGLFRQVLHGKDTCRKGHGIRCSQPATMPAIPVRAAGETHPGAWKNRP